MTKTLTEQWKKKELKDGDYYVLNKAGDIVCDYYIEILGHFDSVLTENVKEVLAPVPSYEEYKELVSKTEQLEKQLVLNKLEPIHLHNCLSRIFGLEEKNKNARKKVKKLQEQLNKANEVINVVQGKIEEEPEIKTKAEENCWKVLEDYKVKWGVK